MLSNIHTHTCLCDGENTPEELVIAAIEKGFCSLGFSGHAFTDFDEPFGIYDFEEYFRIINSLKKKYENKIQIYAGIEEDALVPLKQRERFDYIIGSHHYIKKDDKVLSLDLSYAGFLKCLSLFNSAEEFAECYYKDFCDYILKYKPTVVGHFDLITKFDERDGNQLLSDCKYNEIAEKYLKSVLNTVCFFEINTGAMSRGYRTMPYPAENLLHILKKENARIILTTDCHSAENLDFAMDKTKELLKNVGFKHQYTLFNNEFIKTEL